MQSTEEMAQVMLAHARGCPTEFSCRRDPGLGWMKLLGTPTWDWTTYEYRLIKEPKKASPALPMPPGFHMAKRSGPAMYWAVSPDGSYTSDFVFDTEAGAVVDAWQKYSSRLKSTIDAVTKSIERLL